jgi:iron complex transport system permease protein
MRAGRLAGPLLPAVALGVGLLVLAGCVVWSLGVGQREIAPATVVGALLDPDRLDPDHVIVRQVRMSRTVLAILVGAALAVAGALVQVLTRNPLAEPGTLGVTFGASFAVVVAVALGWPAPGWPALGGGQVGTMVVASVGAGVATVVVYAVGRSDPLRLVLAGTALSALLAGLSLGLRLLDSQAFDDHRFWSVGSLAGRDQQPLLLPAVAIVGAVVAALLLARPLAGIELGDDVAHGLGVPVGAVRAAVLLVATVLAGVATAVAGPIAFAGLIVPHLARRFSAGSVGWLLVLCLVLGPVLLVAADTVGRLVLPTGDAPVAIVTALVGGPVLIAVVRRRAGELAR